MKTSLISNLKSHASYLILNSNLFGNILMFKKLISKVVGDPNKKIIVDLKPLVTKVAALEPIAGTVATAVSGIDVAVHDGVQ